MNLFTLMFIKYIQNKDILTKLIALNINYEIKFCKENKNTLKNPIECVELFMIFLKTHFEESEIYNILKNKKNNDLYLVDTILLYCNSSNILQHNVCYEWEADLIEIGDSIKILCHF